MIEHTPDDRVTLAELRRVTRPGGWLLVTVPAYQALWSAHDDANHHYRRYSRRTLRAAAVQSGWAIARMTSFNTCCWRPPRRCADRAAPRERGRQRPRQTYTLGPAWLNGALEAPLALEARWLARGRTLAAGLSLLAVLRNPAG